MPPEPPSAPAKRASGSQETVAHMQLMLEAWADVLNSPHSTPAERIATLNAIEGALVKYTRSSTTDLVGLDTAATFWNLQGVSGYSLAETLLALLYRLHLELIAQAEALGMAPSEHKRSTVQMALTQVCTALTILQGVTLSNAAARRIMQRKSSLELLLQIVLADYNTSLLPCMLSPPSTPVTSVPDSSAITFSLPSGFALDLLMCVLVDNSVSQDRFADMGGVQQIVQLSHKCADVATSAASTDATVAALKQTDLLCLEFRYFWAQLLKAEPVTTNSIFSDKVGAGVSTPRASLRRTPSPSLNEDDAATDTPKANRRRVTAPLSSTSDADTVTRQSTQSPAQPAPRRLRQSTSTVELRRRATASSLEPAPPLPRPESVQSSSNIPSDTTSNPSFSSALQSARRTLQQRQSIASFRSLDIATHPSTSTTAATPSGAQVLPRNPPGMSSRERPRIPSPLKPRTSYQSLATNPTSSLHNAQSTRKSLDTTQTQATRRPRASLAGSSLASISAASSPSSASFASAFSNLSNSKRIDDVLDDIENRDPSQQSSPTESVARGKITSPPSLVVLSESPRQTLSPSYSVQNMQPVQNNVAPLLKASRSSGMLRSSTTSSFTPVKKVRAPGSASLGLGLNVGLGSTNLVGSAGKGSGAKMPPSPAVRRAQLARAKSLSPTKLALACGQDDGDGMQVPHVPSIPSFHLAASGL